VASALPDVIGRVVLQVPTDTPSARLAVRDRVGRLLLHAPGSSACEILIVRTLTGPVGGAVEAVAVGSLQAALQVQLAEARRSAVPLDGRPVPPRAWAVVAADLSQLLAQYVVDIHERCVGRNWWWKVLAGRLGRGSVTSVLASYPREAPHVVADLVRRRRTDILTCVDDGAAYCLLLCVAEAYRTPRLAAIGRAIERERAGVRYRPVPEQGQPGAPCRPVRPLADLVAVVALQLARDPASARGAEFARFVAVAAGLPDLSADVDGPRGDRRPSADDPASDPGGIERRAASVGGLRPESPATAPIPAGAVGFEHRAPERGSDAPRYPAQEVAAQQPLGLVDAPARTWLPGAPEGPGLGIESAAPLGDPSSAPEPEGPRSPQPGGTLTGLGGVFFLVRLCDELSLPQVFEPEWRLASTLGGWGTLDILVRSLLPRVARWERDPVWEVLSDLGCGPPFERARPIPARVPARLPIQLPMDWSGLDAPCGDPVPALALTLAAPAKQGLRRWLHLVRPVVTGLLVERLGVTAEELSGTLLQRRARIVHDRTHVDVAFPLAEASVPVRRAGLDRDPGWVPEFARVVTFQFDDQAFGGVFS
jgi:hypothetical protein